MSIEVEELCFGYRPGQRVINGLDHAFPAGAVTAVTGPSGGGKSTLLYLLGLLLTPQHGRIRWAGRPIGDGRDRVRAHWRARTVGFVFQDAALDPSRSVLDNIIEPALYTGMPERAAVARGQALMERFGVALRSDHRPGEVSGGQGQRVALCRALLRQPQLILADEPTGNLDVDSRDVVFDALRQAATDGACVVLATHDHDLADRSDEVLRVDA